MNKVGPYTYVSSAMELVMASWAQPRGYRVANYYVLSKVLKTVFLRIIAHKVLRWSQQMAKSADLQRQSLYRREMSLPCRRALERHHLSPYEKVGSYHWSS